MKSRGGVRRHFPLLALLILALSLYLFWVLPRQLPSQPVEVVFEPGNSIKPIAHQRGTGRAKPKNSTPRTSPVAPSTQ